MVAQQHYPPGESPPSPATAARKGTTETVVRIPFTVGYDYVLTAETPELYADKAVAAFIEREVHRPSKQWITNIIAGEQEKEHVILRTSEFILLPDTERVNRAYCCLRTHPPPRASPQWHAHHKQQHAHAASNNPKGSPPKAPSPPRITLNWLGILNDLSVRTLRDLKGEHLPVLQRMLSACLEAVEQHAGVQRDQVMAYVHYPPSVYQLHVHFAYPYGQYSHRDAYRVHSLEGIINNLQIDPMYYQKATLRLATYRQSLHYLALITAAADQGQTDARKKTASWTASETAEKKGETAQ